MKTKRNNKTTNTPLGASESDQKIQLPLAKINFIMMGIAAVVILTGFLLMLGGSSTETAFNPDIFSTRRIVVGPTIAFLGFIFMGFAIIYHPKTGHEQSLTTEETEN